MANPGLDVAEPAIQIIDLHARMRELSAPIFSPGRSSQTSGSNRLRSMCWQIEATFRFGPASVQCIHQKEDLTRRHGHPAALNALEESSVSLAAHRPGPISIILRLSRRAIRGSDPQHKFCLFHH